jgi:subtilisin family serine protease
VPSKQRKPPEEEPSSQYPDRRRTREEAQAYEIYSNYRNFVEPGPADWQVNGIQFFVRRGFLQVRVEYAEQVQNLVAALPAPRRGELLRPLDDKFPSDPNPPVNGQVSHGVEWVALPPRVSVFHALERIAIDLPRVPRRAVGLAYMLDLAPGTSTKCQADEPTPVARDTPPDPPESCHRRAGAGVRVVVLDSGLDPAALTLPWMEGVTGDPDPGMVPGQALGQYAGHGTFMAGVIRCVAPAAEVIVRAAFPRPNGSCSTMPLGCSFADEIVDALEETLIKDQPDVINLAAGTFVLPGEDTMIALEGFYDDLFRFTKGTVIIAAAGNDARRERFYPAAEKWTVAAGALSANLRQRASFSNFGTWVDVFMPGEHLVNAFPSGTLDYLEPPRQGNSGTFTGLARWSGTSFSTGVLSGLVAARMSRTGESGVEAARGVVAQGQRTALPGVGAVALPWLGDESECGCGCT